MAKKPKSAHPLDDEFAKVAEMFERLDPGHDDYWLPLMRMAFFAGATAFLYAVRNGADPKAVMAEMARHRAEVAGFLSKFRH